MLFSWLKKRRRRGLLAAPFPPHWLDYILRSVYCYGALTEGHQAKLRDLVKVFISETHWEGCGGLAVDDEMRVTIAAQACLLILGLEPNYYYDRITTVLIYPDTYMRPQQSENSLVVSHEEVPMYGESWHRGPIVLAWQVVMQNLHSPGDGHNLVLHEFAHHLDGLDGFVDGTPPLFGRKQQGNWKQVTSAEFQRLVRRSEDGYATLLDQYGATDNAEFFAVATECFFDRPQALERQHPELYEALRGFYRQHPAAWQTT